MQRNGASGYLWEIKPSSKLRLQPVGSNRFHRLATGIAAEYTIFFVLSPTIQYFWQDFQTRS